MQIALLHTAQVHVATFDAIFARLAPDVDLVHTVQEDWLQKARDHGLDAIRKPVLAHLAKTGSADAMLCTCSTLGPLADEARVVRIDRPLMLAACANGPKVLVAICLESTRQATLDLLNETAEDLQSNIVPEVLMCDGAWAFFEAGDEAGFAQSITDSILARLEGGDVDCVVLAQASMRAAEPNLTGVDIPVLSSPVLAAQAAIALANG